MDRRFFLKNLPSVGILFFGVKNIFSSILPELFIPGNDSHDVSQLTIVSKGTGSAKIPIWWKSKLAYISASRLAKSLDFHTFFNDTKKKTVLYFPKNQVVVTANNAFVIVDDDAFQMPVPALWKNGEIYLPVIYFAPLMNRRTTLHLNYDKEKQILRVLQKDLNINGVLISEKENGTVIRFDTTKKFSEGEITADMRYGWLHVDFLDGKTDKQLANHTQPAGLVKRIKTFQFPELASIAFYLSREPVSTEILRKPEKNEVLVVLRTKENLSEDEIAELREEQSDVYEPSEDMKQQLEQERKKWLIDTVVIDPGHGGKDPGTVGVHKTYEKDIVLPIAKKLGSIIKEELPDVKVVYTRKTDKFIPLKRRTQIANENNGKVFISIHANAIENRRASGFETYILGPEKGEMAANVVLKENSVISFEDASTRKEYQGINQILATMAQNAFSRQSEYLASLVQQNIHKEVRSLKLKNRGVKQGPFWVMVGATMPNILVETGFIDNPFDNKILRTGSYQYKIARGIFNGLKKYKQDYENAI